MKSHGAIRYGQTQTHSASLASARVVDPVKRAEEFVECVLGHARTGIQDSHDCFGAAQFVIPKLAFPHGPAVWASIRRSRRRQTHARLQANLDGRALVRVANGIADNILDGAVQQAWASHHHTVVHDGGLDMAAPALRLESRIFSNFVNDLFEANR